MIMKVLVVASYRGYSTSGMAPFVKDQGDVLERNGVSLRYFLVKGKGILGYLRSLKSLKKAIGDFNPDVIHAHFGLCGLLANLQRKVPVVTTYHGSDINCKNSFRYSKISLSLSKWNIFVSDKLAKKAKAKRFSVIPCGVDFSVFYPMDKLECRNLLGLKKDGKYVLFSKMFTDPVKNYPLAKEAIDLLDDDVKLVEFVGYNREQAAALMNAVDAVIMTSKSEGSPQFIKEAMACNCPIVSVDVGDVKSVISNTPGCFVTSYCASEIANALSKAIVFGRTQGRENVSHLDNDFIVKQLMKIYHDSI